ncbi:MAG: hypothetical protein SGARI_003341, partial [Bacillariaceae sp.]
MTKDTKPTKADKPMEGENEGSSLTARISTVIRNVCPGAKEMKGDEDIKQRPDPPDETDRLVSSSFTERSLVEVNIHRHILETGECINSNEDEMERLTRTETNRNSISYEKTKKSNRKILHYEAYDSHGRPITVKQWALAMSKDSEEGESLREDFIRIIRNAPFDAVFFETKGVNHRESSEVPFAFVLINSPSLHEFGKKGADSNSFSKHFRKPGEREGTVFDNLGRDARLIAPRPMLKKTTKPYSHLAKFVRTAPKEQVD